MKATSSPNPTSTPLFTDAAEYIAPKFKQLNSPTAAAVYIVLYARTYGANGGVVTLSKSKLAGLLECDVKTVRRAIEGLKSRNLIEEVSNTNQGSSFRVPAACEAVHRNKSRTTKKGHR